jgi:hypothetical protein
MTDKKNNYDYTASERGKRKRERIKNAGLSEIKIVMLKEHSGKVREYARNLYEKEGVVY